MKLIRTIALASVASLGLAGCAGVPVAVSVASLYVDTVLFLRTEKSATDHLISAVAERDCGLMNVLRNGRLCEDAPAPPLVVAVMREVKGAPMDGTENVEGGPPLAVARPAPAPEPPPVQVAPVQVAPVQVATAPTGTITDAAPAAPPPQPAAKPAPAPTAAGGTRTVVATAPRPAAPVSEAEPAPLLVVVGSFLRPDLAEEHRRLFDDAAETAIVAAPVDGRTRYRVVIRPTDRADAMRQLRRVRAQGTEDAWLLPWSGRLSVESAVAALPYTGGLFRM